MTTPAYPTITDELLAELEQLATKATPGPWWIDSHGHCMVSMADGKHDPVFQAVDLVKPATRHPETGNLSHWPNDWDASYIATAHPATILALLQHVRELKADKARLDSGMIITQERDGTGHEYKCHRRGLDLRAMIDEAAEEARDPE